MTKNSNPTPKTTKLSDAQIKALNMVSIQMRYSGLICGFINASTAKVLIDKGLIYQTSGYGGSQVYRLMPYGIDTLARLNGTPLIDIDEAHKTALIENEARDFHTALNEDRQSRLDAYFAEATPAIIEPVETVEPVIAETPTPKMGDTVSGTTERGKPVTGKVVAIGCKVVSGFNYVHVLAGDETHEIAVDSITPIAPRMDEDTYPIMEERAPTRSIAAVTDILVTLRAINEASLIWQNMRDAGADPVLVKKLSDAHDALYAAYLESISVRIALKSSVEAVSSASESIQVELSTVAQETPQIAVTAELQPSVDDDFIPPSTSTYVHPMRLIQPGSVASRLPDEATVKAKRQQQYEEAKARVERINGAYQSPVRKEMHMHDSGYFNQFFKDAK